MYVGEYQEQGLGGIKKALKKVGKVLKKAAPAVAGAAAGALAYTAVKSIVRKPATKGVDNDLTPVVVTAQKSGDMRPVPVMNTTTLASPNGIAQQLAALAAAPANPVAALNPAQVTVNNPALDPMYNPAPELEEVTVTGKPYPAWVWVAGAGVLALLINRKR